MYKQLTFYRIACLNALLAVSLFFISDASIAVYIKIAICLINAAFIIINFNLLKIIQQGNRKLFTQRKKLLMLFICSMYLLTTLLSLYFNLPVIAFFILALIYALVALVIYAHAASITFFKQKILNGNRRIAVIGYDDKAREFAKKLKLSLYHNMPGHSEHNTKNESGKGELLSEYISFARKNRIRALYVSMQHEEHVPIAALTREAEKYCIRVNFIAPDKNFETGVYHVNHLGGMPVLEQYKEPLKSFYKRLLKRTFDLLVSAIVIVFVLSWLIPLVSLLIKLDSKGPVFFAQVRSGRDNNPFTCLKFRSMHINEVSNTCQAAKEDSRITRVGRFLRKTSLDEFPQFLNVFMGDMSIAGPRPHMLYHTEQYSNAVNHYMVRLYLKPGLTGWAQVNGFRGEIKNIQFMEQRVAHDIWYMENWSLLLDIKIMILTFIAILRGDKMAY
ncbi:exopolysaccharide biosynthesis polyprenyl glycosylphosphotransferase [Parafilimonas terrae]|jgi:Undecaprenyl-phosphate glucose phosphotransferase|uniref:Putative colanic acid biosysnthesis UDP-glucose lipid carrier transferase n=1 Tax=Parafilimonas terrae TaxID=1465490 RepID=A0A1I5Z3I9_9BACT|nr:exopolysaccharide biosynthesis polyprenyl glycosylphosphotransferase [Parafilimonas terrae]SFQ51046.1 putative colanic acid biosysnthesis UDP-glucose lipid carrier transferase [Parafilimonas terrae]